MRPSILIKGGTIVNRGRQVAADLYISQGRIEQIAPSIDRPATLELRAEGKYVLPGIIDDQVHFREPGLTHKADIRSESRAAVAGGVTSYMEMPNTAPPAVTQAALAEKYAIAARTSLANYSFYMGAANDNLDEVLRTDHRQVCGVKVFMGSSTGDMLVDDPQTLEAIFSRCPTLIATHCEDEARVRANAEAFRARYGEAPPFEVHPLIRDVEACLKSSTLAVHLARRHGARLHVLHISTAEELALFDEPAPLEQKRVTAEVCVHHLVFDSDDYPRLGAALKCNPAVKERRHREALFAALLDDRLDVVATDHAPHTWAEKQGDYFQAPSGLPLVQHALPIMLGFYHQGRISLERIVDKMCHAPAVCFQVEQRGFLDEGYWADLVIVDLNVESTVSKDNILYKCAWSPFEGHTFKGGVESVVVSGHLAYSQGRFHDEKMGERLRFSRH
jgi:dihydroorotase